jgi:LCP family protein required for cell wall assembly
MFLHRRRGGVVGVAAMILVLLAGCASPVATTTPTPVPTVTPTPTPSPTPTRRPTPSPTPSPTPVPLDQALLESRLTVMIIGTDSNSSRQRKGADVNTDTMIVASVNADDTRIDSVSLPRDTVDVPMPDGSVYHGKINALYRSVGASGLRDAFESLYGIEIDYYAAVNMDDMTQIVDAIGGIDVEVPYAFSDGELGFQIDAGRQHLDGRNALLFSRSRYADGDYARALRQQQVLVAVAQKLADPATRVDLPRLVGSLGSLETDVPLDKLPTLLEIGRRAAGAEVVRQVLGPPGFALFEGIEPGPRGWVMIPNVAAMRGYVQSVMGGG